MTTRFHVYTVANDPEILSRNLSRSPAIASGDVRLEVFWNQSSAAEAYSRALEDATDDLLVFVHQDVVLPEFWFEQVRDELARLDEIDPLWAVAGVFGVDHAGTYLGHVWDSALGGMIGEPLDRPVRVASIDEIVLIVKRGAGATFDPDLPGFHLYGTDIVLNAAQHDRSSYVINAPVVHNTKPILKLGKAYRASYEYMTRKWAGHLPYPTVIVALSESRLPLLKEEIHVIYRAKFRKSTLHYPIKDPEVQAQTISREFLRRTQQGHAAA